MGFKKPTKFFDISRFIQNFIIFGKFDLKFLSVANNLAIFGIPINYHCLLSSILLLLSLYWFKKLQWFKWNTKNLTGFTLIFLSEMLCTALVFLLSKKNNHEITSACLRSLPMHPYSPPPMIKQELKWTPSASAYKCLMNNGKITSNVK